MPLLSIPGPDVKTRASGLLQRAQSTQTHKGPQTFEIGRACVQTIFPMRSQMKVRVLRVPPSRVLEGIDLRPYKLQEGNLYELEPQVAKVLIVWEYAERVSPSGRKKPKK
jgi:hypothetical protein